MSRSALHPAVAALLESRRLGALEQSRHRFTVSREEALLRLREQAQERPRWDWTVQLVRAANALSEVAEARVELDEAAQIEGAEELRFTTIDVLTPGTSFAGLDLSDMLAGALQPDLGEPLGGGEVELRLLRFRMLIGRAINAALAHGPVSVELQTPAGGRRFERREQQLEGRDPYIERRVGGCAGESRFVIQVVDARPGLGSRLGRWLRGQGELRDELASLWRARRLADHGADNLGEDGTVSLGPTLRREPVELGDHALYGRVLDDGSEPGTPELLRGKLSLVRDGVVLLDLGPALRLHDLDPAALSGWVDCPKLRLTADELGVVRDANLELLVAWLHDYSARADGEGKIAWPSSLGEGPSNASGQTIALAGLGEDARRGRELVYVWRHLADQVPAYARARVAALWPSEEALLREHFPELRLVPLQALGGGGDVDPVDLTSLRGGCYEPLALLEDSPIEVASEGEGAAAVAGFRLSIDAYVHRSRTASNGFIVILAYERRVAQIHERASVFPGVTLVCRVRGEGTSLDVAKLRRDAVAVTTIAEAARRRTRAHWEALLAHVMRHARPWENPLLRAALAELGPGTIDLRYQQTEEGLRLAWRDTILLDVPVGRISTAPDKRVDLRDALRLLRERGYILLAHPHKHHARIVSDDPRLQPWLLDSDETRELLARVVGRAALLNMPVVAEVLPLVCHDPVEDQRHLLRGRQTIERELQRSAVDPLARLRLLGHVLVARGLDGDALGVETVPLLERYDPRALRPTRLVTLVSVLSERPRPGLIPLGAVHRGLPRPMLEVGPAVAELLAEVEDFEPGASAGPVATVLEARGPGERSSTTPVRRRSRGVPPLLAKAVIHPFVVGRLQVAGDASSDGIGLWSRGLRIGELELAAPLGLVSGRLLLTPQGQRVGRTKVQEVVRDQARDLLADALLQRTLLPPDGPQRRRLDLFVEYIRNVVRVDDRFGLAEDLGLAEPEDRGLRVAALREMSLGAAPLRPLSDRREALLADVVRQSLAMRVRFDTAILSWRPVKLGKRRGDGSFELEFGLRSRWIQRGLDEDRELPPDEHRRAALLAGVLVVAGFFEQAKAREDLSLGPEHLVVALWRLLRL